MDLAQSPDQPVAPSQGFATLELQTGGAPRPLHYRAGARDESVIRRIFVDHSYALNRLNRHPDLVQHLERKRAEGLRPLILDAGANIGASPVYFALNFPEAAVIAVEPDLGNFQLLVRNAEGLPIRPELAGVAAHEGRMRVVNPQDDAWGFSSAGSGEADAESGVHVPTLPINALYQSLGRGFFPFIAKIDIEGGEGDLFSANTEWLARTPVLIIRLHDGTLPKQRTAAPFLKCIAELDRDFVPIGEHVFSIANDLETF